MARQLDKHTAGYLVWKGGQSSSVTTNLVHDTEKSHYVGSVQVSYCYY